jgi:23S rRNA-/tRNA-specific pseudouridylate synthase
LNRAAAAVACESFAQRLVKKEYLAVIKGHLDITKWSMKENKVIRPLIGNSICNISKFISFNVKNTKLVFSYNFQLLIKKVNYTSS